MALKTRKPTGAVPWPLILVEGGEKSGKTYTSALLALSSKVGPMYWIDLGEGSADEYGAIPGVTYEIVEHNGTFGSIYQAVTDVRQVAQRAADEKQKPVVLLLDGMNAEWSLLKGWANDRARSTDWNQKKLARNPDAEIDVSQNFWNDANARHQKLMTQLMTFPGIVVMTCRGKEVAAVDENGRPIEKKKDYRVEGQKGLGYDSSCWIRLYRDKPGIIVGARSVHAGIRPGKDEPKRLDPDWSLEWVIFDWLRCDPATARVRDLTELVPDLTPEKIRDEALDPKTSFARIKELYAYANDHFPGVVMTSGTGDEETLLRILKGAGDDRLVADGKRPPLQARQPEAATPAPAAVRPARQAEAADVGEAYEPDPADPWLQRIQDIATTGEHEVVKAEFMAEFGDKPMADPRIRALAAALDAKEAGFTEEAEAA